MLSTDTSDLDEAVDALRRSFPLLRPTSATAATRFRFRHLRSGFGTIAYARMSVDGELTTTGQYPDHVAVGVRHRGAVDIAYGDTAVDTDCPYLRLPGDSRARFSNSDVELVIVDRGAFEESAARYLDGTGRRLITPSVATSAPATLTAARRWRAVARVVAESLLQPTSAPRRDALVELTVTSMLSCFPMTAEASPPPSDGYLPRAVVRAVRFIDEHLREEITVVMVAEAARMSVRGIQAAFRRELGVSPMRYHMRARLDAAHLDLERLDPTTSTVAGIARWWGFDHPARFAERYREHYGRNPSVTLRS